MLTKKNIYTLKNKLNMENIKKKKPIEIKIIGNLVSPIIGLGTLPVPIK